ncbi:MAG: sensor histidine kinase [Propioniciclava sp.]
MEELIAAVVAILVAVPVTLLACWVHAERRRQAAAELAARADPVAEIREVVDALSSAAVIVGPHDEILAYNDSALTEGVVRGTRVGLARLLESVRSARHDGRVIAVDLEQSRPGRTPRELAARAVPLADGAVFLVVDDRTPMLRAEEAARDFLANATHELKTPVGAVSLLAEAITEAPDDDRAVAHFAERIRAEALRLDQLVAQIIQLSRLLGEADIRREAVATDELLARVLAFNADLAERKKVTLTSADPGGLSVLGDPEQLFTALNNLVQNAIAYSDDHARVVVSAREAPEEDGTLLVVSDNGIGIAPTDAERIFERFYRVDYARSREHGGTGLGLSIVEEIVHAHGGEVSVWSKPGAGSTFTVTLPAVPITAEVDR